MLTVGLHRSIMRWRGGMLGGWVCWFGLRWLAMGGLRGWLGCMLTRLCRGGHCFRRHRLDTRLSFRLSRGRRVSSGRRLGCGRAGLAQRRILPARIVNRLRRRNAFGLMHRWGFRLLSHRQGCTRQQYQAKRESG